MAEQVRVLVLEDDFNMLESVCGVLRFHNFDPRAAESAEKAIELAKIIPFELVVSDIRMAGPTDGLGAIRAIKKFRPRIKVVMITGYADDKSCREAVELLVDDYVHKPIKLQVLMEVIERVLKPPSARYVALAGLKRLLQKPMELMNQAKAQKVHRLMGLLELEKQKVVQAFYVALRAKGLSKSASLYLWDELEKLENGWLRLPATPTEEALQALGVAYRKVYEYLVHFQKTGNVASLPTREGRVGRQGFQAMADQVVAGKVAPEELLLLLEARLVPAKVGQLAPPLQNLLQRMMSD